ncbi:MAG: Rieske 2Fe-2S domain-containing protein [Gemmatimonas sp.]
MTPEENERITRVSKGTPAGEMLRRYWWPVWFTELLTNAPVPVRLLGEDLVLFRQPDGRTALVDSACPHRGASLALGRIEADGIRCCYHGWKFDAAGRCVDMPAEPPGSPLRNEVMLGAYPTREVSGLVFAYLGPSPAPEFPRYDLLFRTDLTRKVNAFHEHCNWVQRAENAVDQMHSTVLHASVYPEIALQRPNVKWESTWYGVRAAFDVPKRQTKVSHFLFPSNSRYFGARVNDQPSHIMRFRVPVDDVSTRTFVIRARECRGGGGDLSTEGLVSHPRGVYERVEDGWWGLASREQDRAAQESQGLIADRTREILGTSDRGVILFRRMLFDAIDTVERGEDPPGLVRGEQRELIAFDAMKARDGVAITA